jgi:GTPase SAR1 family protein
MEVLQKDKVKMVFVGDPSVGKTCLIKTYVEKKFPHEVPVSLYDVYDSTIVKGQQQVSVEINDTAG